jgi:hypothetical protein
LTPAVEMCLREIGDGGSAAGGCSDVPQRHAPGYVCLWWSCCHARRCIGDLLGNICNGVDRHVELRKRKGAAGVHLQPYAGENGRGQQPVDADGRVRSLAFRAGSCKGGEAVEHGCCGCDAGDPLTVPLGLHVSLSPLPGVADGRWANMCLTAGGRRALLEAQLHLLRVPIVCRSNRHNRVGSPMCAI